MPGTEHLAGLLSYDPLLERPGFRASSNEVKDFYNKHPPVVDPEALQDLESGTTVLVASPYFLEYEEIEAALGALRKVIDEKKLNITIVSAVVAQGQSQTSKGKSQTGKELRSLDADLKQKVMDDIGKAVAQERENQGAAAKEEGQFWTFTYAIFAGKYLYVGSAGTRTTSSKAQGKKLIKACKDLNTEEFLTVARALLKPRMDGHQGELIKGSKNNRWKELFTILKREHDENVYVGDVVVPLMVALCKEGDTKDELVRDVGLAIEDEGIALVAELANRVQRCPRCPFTGPRVYKPS